LSLSEQAAAFADSLTTTLSRTLPGASVIRAVGSGATRFVVQSITEDGLLRRIPLYVAGERLAELTLKISLEMDADGTYLKAVSSSFALHSVLDQKQPLVRLEFIGTSTGPPVAHWHFHAERGSLTHLLTLSHANNPREAEHPHTLSSLHFPVGGERFRPCAEDFLEFLIRECGVDSEPAWKPALAEGRQRWRRTQVRAAVRDLQHDAAGVLRDQGWTVEPPNVDVVEKMSTLTQW
jgi:hypothetical protein